MSERPLLDIVTATNTLMMTRMGATIGLQGFVHWSTCRVVDLSLTLVQNDIRVRPTHLYWEGRLINPRNADLSEDTGIDSGLFISVSFPWVSDLNPGLGVIDSEITWSDGSRVEMRLCFVQIEIARSIRLPSLLIADERLIGIAMATYNPEPILFSKQIDSIRHQTHENWVCVISDDMSNPRWIDHIRASIVDDPRFILLQSKSRLGFYRNFERAIASLPNECGFIALSDQDDIWKVDRLSTGVTSFSDQATECIFSNMEVVTSKGELLSRSFWVYRRELYGSISGLLLANVSTGMTMLFRREITNTALPFPATPNMPFHDAWIALVAEARGSLRYLPQALVEYVQHGGNHTGALKIPEKTRTIMRHKVSKMVRLLYFLRKTDSLDSARHLLVDDSTYWSGLEAVKMRIFADAIATRLPDLMKRQPNKRMLQMCKRFKVFDLLRAGIDWKDRHRRTLGLTLMLDSFVRRIVLAQVDRRKTNR